MTVALLVAWHASLLLLHAWRRLDEREQVDGAMTHHRRSGLQVRGRVVELIEEGGFTREAFLCDA